MYLGDDYGFTNKQRFSGQTGIDPTWGYNTNNTADAAVAIQKAADIFFKHSSVLTNGTLSQKAALQVAVCEALYDTGASAGAYDLASGRFKASGDSTAVALALTWLGETRTNDYVGYILKPDPTVQYGQNGQGVLFDVAPVPTVVFVDGNYVGKADGVSVTFPDGGTGADPIIGYDAFATIQEAVNAVSAGGTVNVAAGIYVEQVEITNDITVIGSGSGTIIQSPAILTKSYTTSAANKPVVHVHDTANVVLQNFVVDGNGQGGESLNYRFMGVSYYRAGGLIANLTVKGVRDNPIDGDQTGDAIYAYSDIAPIRNLEVVGCNVFDFQKNGITMNGADLVANVHGNQVTGAGEVNFIAQNGIQFGFGSSGLIQSNAVSGCYYIPDDEACGILIYQSGATITANVISACQQGVGVDTPVAMGVIANNNLAGNEWGVENDSATLLDARNNWWGSACGPTITSNPSVGEAAVSANVLFSPWLGDGMDTSPDPGFQPNLTSVVAPTIICPSDVVVNTLQSKDPYFTGTATASGICGAVTYNDDRSGLTNCNATGIIRRTWTAVDANNNPFTCVQQITVIDTSAPALVCPANIVTNNASSLCSQVVTFSTSTAKETGYFQGFEDPNFVSGNYANNPSVDWNDYDSHLYRVPSGTDGITSRSGVAHAVIDSTVPATSPNYTNSGVFSRLGGYSSVFGTGYRVALDIYMDLSNPGVVNATPTSGYAWDLSAAASGQDNQHRRDYIFHTAAYGPTGIVVAADNNSSDDASNRRNDLLTLPNHAVLTHSGWYTFEWIFRNANNVLAVDLNVRDAGNSLVFSQTLSDPSDLISTVVGGNRYLWFTFLAVDKLAIDNTTLERNVPVVSSPASGSTFPLGTTIVTNTAIDACGNNNSCTFTVTVNDTRVTPPPVVYVDVNYAGLPTCTGVTFPGVGGLGAHSIGYDAFATIQAAVNAVGAGGTVNVAAGTYNESPNINKSVSLLGVGGRDVTTIVLQTGPTYLGSIQISASNVLVDGFTIVGYDAPVTASPYDYASSDIWLLQNTTNIEIANNRIKVGNIGPESNGDDGIGVLTTYATTIPAGTDNLNVHDNIFEPVNTTGRRAFYINPGIDHFTFSNNVINGEFTRPAMAQALNGVVENNTVVGTGSSAGLGTWGYPDASLWGHTVFQGNVISNTATAISLYDSEDVVILNNTLDGNGNGIYVSDTGYITYNPANGVEVQSNSFAGDVTAGIANTTTGLLAAAYNWWGSACGPTTAANPAGDGDIVSTNVAFIPWLGDGTDTQPTVIGFQPNPTLVYLPAITGQPTSTTSVAAGNPVSLSVTATGAGLTYQWQRGGVNLTNDVRISGATSSVLTINPVFPGDAAGAGHGYVCVATTACGSSTDSHEATLIVTPGSGTPAVTIATANSSVLSNSLPITGVVTPGNNRGLESVQYAYQVNGVWQAWQTAGISSKSVSVSNWTATLTGLQPGSFKFAVYALNNVGNTSKPKTNTYTYVVWSQLTLATNGNGTVKGTTSSYGTPNLGTTWLQIPRSYTVTAVSAKNWLFENWTVVSNGVTRTVAPNSKSTCTFVMSTNQSVTANFVLNQFLGAAGVSGGSGTLLRSVLGSGRAGNASDGGLHSIERQGRYDGEQPDVQWFHPCGRGEGATGWQV